MTPAEKVMRDAALANVSTMTDEKLAATLKHHAARSTDHSVSMRVACKAEQVKREVAR